MQVHDAFASLDRNRIAELLNADGEDDDEHEDGADIYVDALERMIQASATSSEEALEMRAKLDRLREVLTSPIPGALADNTDLLRAALRYASRQPSVFQRAYLKNFLQECTQAYDVAAAPPPGEDTDERREMREQLAMSCPKGVWERLVFALGQAATLDGAVGDEAADVSPERRAEYSALASAIFPERMTRSQLALNIRGLVSRCFSDEDSASARQAASGEDAKRAVMRECVLGKIRAIEAFASVDAALLERVLTEELSAVNDIDRKSVV